MKKFDFIVHSTVGIHARPASCLTEEAKKYQCRIWVEKNGKRANAKNVMDLMLLSVLCNDQVTFVFDGVDEEVAAENFAAYCKNKL